MLATEVVRDWRCMNWSNPKEYYKYSILKVVRGCSSCCQCCLSTMGFFFILPMHALVWYSLCIYFAPFAVCNCQCDLSLFSIFSLSSLGVLAIGVLHRKQCLNLLQAMRLQVKTLCTMIFLWFFLNVNFSVSMSCPWQSVLKKVGGKVN